MAPLPRRRVPRPLPRLARPPRAARLEEAALVPTEARRAGPYGGRARTETVAHLFLGSNHLTGTLPNFNDMPPYGFTKLEIERCFLEGPLPSGLGSLFLMQTLHFHGNDGLTGTLPRNMQNMTKLESLK